MVELFGYSLTYEAFASFCIVGVLVGMSKTGVHGTSMLAVPLLAVVFGGKSSSGIMLPALIMADVVGVIYYHKHAESKYLWKLLPWTVIGVLIGTYFGQKIDDQQFRTIMGVIIFLSLGVMIWMERANKDQIPDYTWFAAIMGITAGFTTMVGNLAGSAMALYLLSMRLPKNQFIGTAAWFFICVNIFKVPFHIWVWETVTFDSFLLDLILLPFIGIGAVLGIKIIKKISDQYFRWFIILMTCAAALFMIF
ncbi:sulfite exporter TauE/SafE family protein [Reichenbachiella agarivorans]|uniref:Probable membrane transporter protein n=1 Tax=Reichenbachiella agarivorans TaxID=2979464 RepID=A0ABY6CU46_9BACT|nr:sulfite exporter TauE/SafE family protein [Reichenbachiella agarivorans]UXP34047.1 sulfite exporter TauE/SafE family protein [Reichenbachiella agarivorans]